MRQVYGFSGLRFGTLGQPRLTKPTRLFGSVEIASTEEPASTPFLSLNLPFISIHRLSQCADYTLVQAYNRVNTPNGYTSKDKGRFFNHPPKLPDLSYLAIITLLNHGNLPGYRRNISNVMFLLVTR